LLDDVAVLDDELQGRSWSAIRISRFSISKRNTDIYPEPQMRE
jgi:hypothetical protein